MGHWVVQCLISFPSMELSPVTSISIITLEERFPPSKDDIIILKPASNEKQGSSS